MLFKSSIFIATILIALNSKATIADGLWSTNCTKGLKKEQVYKNKEVLTSEHFYQDAACQDESFLFATLGSVSYYNEQNNFVDFVYGQIQLTLYKQVLVDDFNSRHVCGFSDWKLAEAQTITGLKCALFSFSKEAQIPFAGDVRFGIFSVEQDKLYYGQLSSDHDSSSALKRPLSLNRSIEYIFQHSL